MRVKDFISKEVFILYENDNILQASKFMKEERIRNLPVVDKHNKLIGLVTLRELVDALTKGTVTQRIGDIMITEVKAIGPETPLKGAIEVMIVNRYGSLPVIDNSRKLLGMITEFDLLKRLYSIAEMPDDFYITEKKSFQL